MSNEKNLILAYDVGTTSLKTCAYRLNEKIELVASSMGEYKLTIGANSLAEQNPDDWFKAMTSTTRQVLTESGLSADQVAGISFCSQMQGLVLVDKNGKALRPSMSYMDGRAEAQKLSCGSKSGRRPAGPKIEGVPINKVLDSIRITGIAPLSVKDPLWKYHWVRENEPDVFKSVYKYLDVKEYLIMRLTGRAVMTRDSAAATFMYDNRPGKGVWSKAMCRAYNVNPDHLADIIDSTECAGGLLKNPASEMGLPEGVPVFGGGGDASLIGLGAGAVNENDAHIYMGTSGWVSVLTSKRLLDLTHMIASITGAIPDKYQYFCEQETAGKCMEWVKKHLAMDEIGVYLEKKEVSDDPETVYANLFEFLSDIINQTEPGCGGVLFTPWLQGSRSPFEDVNARGMFFNIGLNTGKRMLVRSVIEGLAYNIKWMLESVEGKLKCNETLRFVGGGALSDVNAQIISDILERHLEVPEYPQNTGALGAAVAAGMGLELISGFSEVPSRIKINKVFKPDNKNREVYERNYSVFKKLYASNKQLFAELNK
ncbi:MAG: FGGY-family carbohydrate kinase [Spirochaetales bacterium]|nr:FGGY-family carbohydrate kinase [Spirochaetales bacterium]